MTVILRGTRIPRNLRKDSNFQAEIYWKTDEEALAETTQILESLQARSPRLVKEALAGLGDDWRIWMHDPENALKELQDQFGFEVVYLPVNSEGKVDPEELKKAMEDLDPQRELRLMTFIP